MDRIVLLDKSRNVFNPLFNKKTTKMSLLNNSKGFNPLIKDLHDNYNKEMNLLEYEESILHKVISDLNSIDTQ